MQRFQKSLNFHMEKESEAGQKIWLRNNKKFKFRNQNFLAQKTSSTISKEREKVLNTCGNSATKLCALANFAAWIMFSFVASVFPKLIFSEIDPSNRTGSWLTTPIWLLRCCTFISRRSCPSIKTCGTRLSKHYVEEKETNEIL